MDKTGAPAVPPGVLATGGNNGPFGPGLDNGRVGGITGNVGRVALEYCRLPIS